MNNLVLKTLIMAGLLLITFVYSMTSGVSDISVVKMFESLFLKGDGNTYMIINQIRFPRVILAIIAGAGLSAGGCVFQGILRNPLADPFTLGISGGAAFGASVGFVFGFASLNWFFLPLFSFLRLS